MTEQAYIINSFSTPNAVVDNLMHLLTPEENVVLSFMCRHIFGWKDKIASSRNNIALSCFVDGFTTDKGYRCNGTGLSLTTVRNALNQLCKFRVIEKCKRSDGTLDIDEKGQKWALLFSGIDMPGLEQRLADKHTKQKKRTQKGLIVLQEKRLKERGVLSDDTPIVTQQVGGIVGQSGGGIVGHKQNIHVVNPLVNPEKDIAAALPLAAQTETSNAVKLAESHLDAFEASEQSKLETFYAKLTNKEPDDAVKASLAECLKAYPYQDVCDAIQFVHNSPQPKPRVMEVLERWEFEKAMDDPSKAPKVKRANPMYDAIFSIWGYTAALNTDYAKFLTGKATKKQHKPCNLNPAVSPDELLAWFEWYKKQNTGVDGKVYLIESPAKIQSSINEYRRELTQSVPVTVTTSALPEYDPLNDPIHKVIPPEKRIDPEELKRRIEATYVKRF